MQTKSYFSKINAEDPLTRFLITIAANRENWPGYAVITLIYVIVAFILFYRIRRIKADRTDLSGPEENPGLSFLTEKITGFLLFGVIPFIIFGATSGLKYSETNMTPGNSGQYWYILLILLIIITFLTFNGSKKKAIQEKSPRIRIKNWTVKYYVIAITGWLIYINGYELLFRGILWTVCYTAFGFWVALLINIVLYAAVHIDQGLAISLGAVPFGILLCLLTFLTGSFLFAFLIHGWLAVSTEVFAVYHNPDMNFIIKKPARTDENTDRQ